MAQLSSWLPASGGDSSKPSVSFQIKADLWNSQEKPYQCAYCRNTYKQLYNLLIHDADKHQGKRGKLYQCLTCKKVFQYEFSLKQHEKLHLEEKRIYSCKACSRTYQQESGVKLHWNKHHPGQKYCHSDHFLKEKKQCPVCPSDGGDWTEPVSQEYGQHVNQGQGETGSEDEQSSLSPWSKARSEHEMIFSTFSTSRNKSADILTVPETQNVDDQPIEYNNQTEEQWEEWETVSVTSEKSSSDSALYIDSGPSLSSDTELSSPESSGTETEDEIVQLSTKTGLNKAEAQEYDQCTNNQGQSTTGSNDQNTPSPCSEENMPGSEDFGVEYKVQGSVLICSRCDKKFKNNMLGLCALQWHQDNPFHSNKVLGMCAAKIS